MGLLNQFLDTGLLQFGHFVESDNQVVPYRLRLDMLPSYPELLQEIAGRAALLLGDVDHLLSTPDALPFGTALTLWTGIPLVYSRGSEAIPSLDLVGAYDIGHPACLLTNRQDDRLTALAQNAARVGIDVQQIISIVDEGLYPPDRISQNSLIDLHDALGRLVEDQRLVSGQAETVRRWLDTNRHPG